MKEIWLRHGAVCSLLLVLAVIVLIPVLVHGRWGTFDDAANFLDSGRQFTRQPETLSQLPTSAGLRIGFFAWCYVLWVLFPENPIAIHAVYGLLMALTIVLAYFSCYGVTKNRAIAAGTASLLFLAPGLFECFYTMDKQEAYLPVLFSGILLLHALSGEASKRTSLFACCAGLIALSLCAFTSKETSTVLVLFSGAYLFLNLISSARDQSKRNALLMFVSLFGTYVALKVIASHVFVTEETYVKVTLDASKVLHRAMQYMPSMPGFFGLLCANVAAGLLLLVKTIKRQTNSADRLVLASAATACAASLALFAFDSFSETLLYIWLPIYSFALPPAAYLVSLLAKSRSAVLKPAVIAVAACTVALFFGHLPNHILQGQFQLNMDELTYRLSSRLIEIAQKRGNRELIAAMPTFELGGFEVPEAIEIYVRSRLDSAYYPMIENQKAQRFTIFDFLDQKVGEGKEINKGEYDLGKFRNVQLVYLTQCPPGYVGWTGFQNRYDHWIRRPYGKDALLIVPYGDVPAGEVLYRGAGIFANQPESHLYRMPQLKLTELSSVDKTLKFPLHKDLHMGWKIFQVAEAAPISLPTASSDGWIDGAGEIVCAPSQANHVLEIDSGQPTANNWSVILPSGAIAKADFKQVGFPKSFKLQAHVPLPEPWRSPYPLKIKNARAGEKLHIDRIRFVGLNGSSLR